MKMGDYIFLSTEGRDTDGRDVILVVAANRTTKLDIPRVAYLELASGVDRLRGLNIGYSHHATVAFLPVH